MAENFDFDKLYGGKYLKAEDLPDEGVSVMKITTGSWQT